jgi:WD40 repeat protein
VNDVAIGPDSNVALSGSDDGISILWDLATGDQRFRLSADSGPIISVAISPDSTSALTSSSNGAVLLWDLDSGVLVRTLSTGLDAQVQINGTQSARHDERWTVAFRPGRQEGLGVAHSGRLLVWELTSGLQRDSFQSSAAHVSSAALHPKGDQILLGTEYNRVILLNLDGQADLLEFHGHKGSILAVAFSPDGRQALSASSSGDLRLWDLSGGARTLKAHSDLPATSVDISPDGRRGLTGRIGGSVLLWDYETGEISRELAGQGKELLGTSCFVKGGEAVVAVTGSGANPASGNKLLMWDAAMGDEIWREQLVSAELMSAEISRDGRLMAVSAVDGTLWLWDLESRQGRLLYDASPYKVPAMAFNPDATRLLIGLDHGPSDVSVQRLRLLHAETGQEVLRFTGDQDAVTDVAFSPDGHLALSSSLDQQVVLWDATTGQQVRLLSERGSSVQVVAFSPDGKLVTGGSVNGHILVWDLETNSRPMVLIGHGGAVRDLRFALDPDLLVSAANDGNVYEWRLNASGAELQAWIEGNRYIPELTCEQRLEYGVEPTCPGLNGPADASP